MIPTKRLFACLFALSTVLFAGRAYSQSALIVALGDSNTAGFGVAPQQAFPAQLEALLRGTGYDVRVANAGIPGDTTQRMLGRVDAYAPPGTRIVIVQGGYNDLLMGRNPTSILANLEAIVSRLAARRITAVLCGFFNPSYDAVGSAIARRYGAVFVDGGLCYDSRYRGPDGLHMSAVGHQVIAMRLLPVMQRLLTPAGRRRGFES